MIRFELGGYYLDSGGRVQLPLILQPSIPQLMNYLSILEGHNGVLVLENDQEDKYVPYKLVLYSEHGIYMVLLETSIEDGDIDVRTFYDKGCSRELIPILGESFSKASTVKNFSHVIKAFKEFYETGNVNRGLLN
ncbi:hypothetical protein [Pantoea sp. NGS-ED-1003]|uniref:DUF6911 family protein n=1 Tax=Pantoea sp. NGS-ED-1003 TaxID=1526743 RepID=UPI001268B6A3|nr:hypothetical protein [Pantoea sp. NGS-ED-1003]